MFARRMVIQKIDAESRGVRLYQNFDLRSPWSFEPRGLPDGNADARIFPFVVHGADRFSDGRPGAETQVRFSSDGRVMFADDYVVLEPFVIAILFPEGYVPDIYKFKSKPFIPTGVGLSGASMSPPGHFDVYFNAAVRRSAVVFLLTKGTCFGFKCVARKRTDFPKGRTTPFLGDLYATLGVEESHPIQVTAADLAAFGGQFASTANLSDLATAINRLVEIAGSGGRDEVRGVEAESLSRKLQESLSTAASAVQLTDSYLTGGSVAAVVSRLIAYLSL